MFTSQPKWSDYNETLDGTKEAMKYFKKHKNGGKNLTGIGITNFT